MNILFILLGLTFSAPEVESTDKLRVVTTLQVYRDVVEKIGGDLVSVEALVHPRRDPHYIPANPLMQRKVSESDLFIETGRSLELWTANLGRAWTGKNRLIASRLARCRTRKNSRTRKSATRHQPLQYWGKSLGSLMNFFSRSCLTSNQSVV